LNDRNNKTSNTEKRIEHEVSRKRTVENQYSYTILNL
jgi:hypothetical protein